MSANLARACILVVVAQASLADRPSVDKLLEQLSSVSESDFVLLLDNLFKAPSVDLVQGLLEKTWLGRNPERVQTLLMSLPEPTLGLLVNRLADRDEKTVEAAERILRSVPESPTVDLPTTSGPFYRLQTDVERIFANKSLPLFNRLAAGRLLTLIWLTPETVQELLRLFDTNEGEPIPAFAILACMASSERRSDTDENSNVAAVVKPFLARPGNVNRVAETLLVFITKDVEFHLDDEFNLTTLAQSAVLNISPAHAGDLLARLLERYRRLSPGMRGAALTQSLAEVAVVLQDSENVDSLPLLKATLTELGRYSSRPKKEVARAVRELERVRNDRWGERLRRGWQWAASNPKTAGVMGLVLLFGLCFLTIGAVMVPFRPLTVLRWNERLASLDYELPSWLGKAKVPTRKVFLIGLFHYHPRILAAWVAKYAPRATENLSFFSAFKDRSTFVPLPVRVDGSTHPQLGPEHLQEICATNRWRLLLKGEGGLGKTSLALQIARWGLSPKPEQRLCKDRQMLPVVLDSTIGFDVRKDLATFKNVARARLQELIAPEDPVSDKLFERLLQDRRVLVILDGLSELPDSTSSPSAAGTQNPDFPASAILITSRDDAAAFGPRPTIEPLRIDPNHLLPFINAYLASGSSELTDSELFDASRRLAEMVTTESGITPLLARLFAEQLVALQKEARAIADLPRSVPDLMLAYLNTLNRDHATKNTDIHRAAQIAAWECLRETFKPGQAASKEIIAKAFKDAGLEGALLDVLEARLKILITLQPAETHVQLTLDPLTEYLAAMYVIKTLAGNKEAWSEFFERADAKPDAPKSIHGFLAAIRNCCDADPALKVPEQVMDELASRIGLDLEAVGAARLKQRIHSLIKGLESDVDADRMHSIRQLGERGSGARDAAERLSKLMLDDASPGIRAAAAGALGSIGKCHKEILFALENDPERSVREAAASALGRVGAHPPDVIPALINALTLDEDGVRSSSATSLARFGSEASAAEPALVKALDSCTGYAGLAVIHALREIGATSEEAGLQLARLVKQADSPLALPAARALARFPAINDEMALLLASAFVGADSTLAEEIDDLLPKLDGDGKDAISMLEMIRDYASFDATVRARAFLAHQKLMNRLPRPE